MKIEINCKKCNKLSNLSLTKVSIKESCKNCGLNDYSLINKQYYKSLSEFIGRNNGVVKYVFKDEIEQLGRINDELTKKFKGLKELDNLINKLNDQKTENSSEQLQKALNMRTNFLKLIKELYVSKNKLYSETYLTQLKIKQLATNNIKELFQYKKNDSEIRDYFIKQGINDVQMNDEPEMPLPDDV